MSKIDVLLARLPDARRVGETRWMARCPAHEDRSPSLSIREIDEKVLLHCFAGCSNDDVMSALGLRWADLSDSPRIPDMPRARLLNLDPLEVERAIVRMAIGDAKRGAIHDIETHARVEVARERIAAGAKLPDQSAGGGVEAAARAILAMIRLLESSAEIACDWTPRIDAWGTACGAEVPDYVNILKWKYCPACGRIIRLEPGSRP
jgi:hypothetical protein